MCYKWNINLLINTKVILGLNLHCLNERSWNLDVRRIWWMNRRKNLMNLHLGEFGD